MIPERANKGNNLRLALILAAIIILVAIAAFGLGRLSAQNPQEGSLVIHQPGGSTQ